jgi:uncharacterized protein
MSLNEHENTLVINVPVSEVKQPAAYPKIKDIFRLFFVFLFYNIIFGLAMAGVFIFCDTYNIRSPLLKPFVTFVISIITMLVVIRYAKKKANRREQTHLKIKFDEVPLWLFPLLIISTLALIVGLERISDMIPMPAAVDKFFKKMFTTNFFSIINLVIAAPILEEILCRGIVLRGLLKNYRPRYAIIISALFFAILHLNPWQALPAFFGGLFIGWVYYKTQSVIPGMVIHATINSTAAVLLFSPEYQKGFLIRLGLPYYIALCTISGVILLSSCIIINKRISPVSETINP